MKNGKRKAGYAITTTSQVIEAKPLPGNTSAQKAEIIALIRALELAKDKRINIWTDSKYAFGVVHAHGAIWKECGPLNTQGKQINHATEILQLLEAVQLPEEVAIMYCKGHQQGDSDQEIGNNLADFEAKRAAEQFQIMSLIPDGKLTIEKSKPRYSKEDTKLIEDLKGQENKEGWVQIPDGQIVIPYNQLWKLVQEEHNKTHWGSNSLHKYLDKQIVGRNLYTTVQLVTKQCQLCLKNNPKTENRNQIGTTGRGSYQGHQWQIDFSELPRKGGYRCLLVLTDTFSGWPEAFPCRLNKAKKVIKILFNKIISSFWGTRGNFFQPRLAL
ncbi:uncharacterized protein LOC133218564 [Neopsephotus bourkii]|uniref:uncharacterized protein LOC133218564 n=1 Tax=Neopsephotus bourkii TaxID=309878 RepID=UPI002AA50C96|nr:uncharacterized protein LOC133218564 [Neopsephotus bourkii]